MVKYILSLECIQSLWRTSSKILVSVNNDADNASNSLPHHSYIFKNKMCHVLIVEEKKKEMQFLAHIENSCDNYSVIIIASQVTFQGRILL